MYNTGAVPRKENVPKVSSSFHNITLRQWAILFSILFLIVACLMLLCTLLTFIHTKQVLHLLEDDIQEEHQKDEHLIKMNMTSNEAILIKSHHNVLETAQTMKTFMWITLACFGFTILLVYAVLTRKPSCMLPWIIFSSALHKCIVVAYLLAYYKLVAVHVENFIFVIVIGATPIFYSMWTAIFMYYMRLRRALKAAVAKGTTKTIISSYGVKYTIHEKSFPMPPRVCLVSN